MTAKEASSVCAIGVSITEELRLLYMRHRQQLARVNLDMRSHVERSSFAVNVQPGASVPVGVNCEVRERL